MIRSMVQRFNMQRDARRTVTEWLDRLPRPILLAAPGAVLVLIAALVPDGVRQGFATDLEIYRRYGSQLLGGLVPYRDVPIEYPPLAIVPMVLPFGPGPEPL